ncbi:hypothetical protein KO465_04755 [Candidatus Micrarchaeota archaeon]|nr:hypothetical protein [Candidatus Micrarchaeota archaeon]
MPTLPRTIVQPIRRAEPVPSTGILINEFLGLIFDGEYTIDFNISGSYTTFTPAARNPALDIIFDCEEEDSAGNDDQGILNITLSIIGTWLNTVITASPLAITVSIRGDIRTGFTASGLLEITLSLKPDEFVNFATYIKLNWIQWSQIGSLSFTKGRDNVAGEKPLDWYGRIYCLKKLLKTVVAYGQSGVTLLTPAGTTFGMSTINRVGLKGKHAVTGDDAKHFFIDSDNKMWKLGDGIKLLDYAEYFKDMNDNLVMTYDNTENMIYICDGLVGYVFDVVNESLGKGPKNITGLGYKAGTLYVTAPDAVTIDPFEVWTDIFDLGYRGGKTIFSLEFGTNLDVNLYAAIEYRRATDGMFTQTPWYKVGPTGRVFITAWGREFRFGVKTLTYSYFDLDYIKVNGVADEY